MDYEEAAIKRNFAEFYDRNNVMHSILTDVYIIYR